MPRIGIATPLKAYDHIAQKLQEANGGDGRISRDDAANLVKKLKDQGLGTEALVAENLFKMIDARDARPGATVTGYDLARDREFVEQAMLKNYDVEGGRANGFSYAEIANMSPTARGLIELGQVLSLEGPQGREGHDGPKAGLDHVCNLLKQAAGDDGISSRADIKNMVESLREQGRGTEAEALWNFAWVVDMRDGGARSGNRITASDIDSTRDWAAERMLENRDENRNGYSAEERESWSKTAKSFYFIGQMIDAGIIKKNEAINRAAPELDRTQRS